MNKFYESLFLAYQRIFDPSGGASKRHSTENYPIDSLATHLGNAYRGSGVLVGLLGAMIIFCAVAPVGFGVLHDHSAIYFGIAEVILMTWVLFTIFSAHQKNLKGRWIEARKQAEIERYAPLKESMTKDLAGLQAAALPLLDGANCQITYNRKKHAQYHAIEHSAEKATLIGFGLSLLAAVLHLVVHADALIFLTAFLPAMVGALHGINSFLRLEQLALDHQKIAAELEGMKASFTQAVGKNDLNAARLVVDEMHSLLTEGHLGWIDIANRLEVRAP